MPLSTTENRKSYDGDGTTTAFSFPYLFFADADLTVILVDDATGTETTQTITTHYTVAGAGDAAGGTVTMVTAPAVGKTLVILREVEIKQEVDLVENDPLPVASIEEALDRGAMVDQQLQEQVDRSLRLSPGSSASTQLPVPVGSRVIGWNEAGTALQNYAPVDNTLLSVQLAAASGAELVGYGATTVDGTLDNILAAPGGNTGNIMIADATAAAGFEAGPKLLRSLDGFDPDKISTNVLRFYPGWCANSNASDYAIATSSIDVDMSTVGVNGLDTGTPTDGVGYFPYVIKNTSTGAVGIVISASIIYGGVTLPAGYSVYRKLPFGFVYNSTRDGIPNFHLAYWPKPFIRFTDAGEDATYRALASGTATAWTEINLSAFIPDNARMAYLYCRTSATGTNGKAQVRTVSTSNGISVGDCLAGGVTQYHTLHIRITSDMKIYYQVTGGASLTVFVLGYSMTEPS